MRVGHVIRSLDMGNLGGGADLFATRLANALQPFGVEQSFWICLKTNTTTELTWQLSLEQKGYRVFWLQDDDRLNPFIAIPKFCKLFGQYPLDILHAHYQPGALYTLSLSAPVKRIRTVHTGLEWGNGLFASVMRAVWTRFVFPLSFDAQVGVSQAIVSQMQGYWAARFSRAQVMYIPNFLSSDYFDCFEKRQRNLTTKEIVLGTVARLTKTKGVEYLLAAMPSVLERYPQTVLWIIGDGEQRSALEKQAQRLAIDSQVVFWGNRSDVRDLMMKMDMFVLPSLFEGLPTVILESMACGLPVIATSIPGTTELVKDGQTGWLVPPANVDALAQKICHVLSAPFEREQVIETAYRQLQNFSAHEVTQQYLELYHQLLSKK